MQRGEQIDCPAALPGRKQSGRVHLGPTGIIGSTKSGNQSDGLGRAAALDHLFSLLQLTSRVG